MDSYLSFDRETGSIGDILYGKKENSIFTFDLNMPLMSTAENILFNFENINPLMDDGPQTSFPDPPQSLSESQVENQNTITDVTNEKTYENFLDNEENEEMNLPEKMMQEKLKGKSCPFSQIGEKIYGKIKAYYGSTFPAIFRKDGIRKKVKTHFLNWVKKTLETFIPKSGRKKNLKFNKLKTNKIIDIKFNYEFLLKTPCQVYLEDSKENMEKMMTLVSSSGDNPFLSTPLYELYNSYMQINFLKDYKKLSKTFLYQIEDMEPQEKQIYELYLPLYKLYAENFVAYFTNTEPNSKHKSD